MPKTRRTRTQRRDPHDSPAREAGDGEIGATRAAGLPRAFGFPECASPTLPACRLTPALAAVGWGCLLVTGASNSTDRVQSSAIEPSTTPPG